MNISIQNCVWSQSLQCNSPNSSTAWSLFSTAVTADRPSSNSSLGLRESVPGVFKAVLLAAVLHLTLAPILELGECTYKVEKEEEQKLFLMQVMTPIMSQKPVREDICDRHACQVWFWESWWEETAVNRCSSNPNYTTSSLTTSSNTTICLTNQSACLSFYCWKFLLNVTLPPPLLHMSLSTSLSLLSHPTVAAKLSATQC